jgi:toxin YoeB
MRKIEFESDAFQEFVDFLSIDKKLYKKIIRMINEIERTPFEGIENPEPLKH